MVVQSVYDHETTPQVEFIVITPQIAEDMLKRNVQNRDLNKKRSQALADLHGTKHWKQTADTIKFGPDGKLLDGQHRLHAITLSGIPQGYYVAYNVDPDAQMVMDTGMRRNLGQHMKINGVKNYNAVAAAANLAYAWEGGARTFKALRPVSIPEKWDFYLERKERLDRAASVSRKLAQRWKGMPSAYYAFFYYLFADIDLEDAEYFFDFLTGEFGHEPQNPISQLRKALNDDREKNFTNKAFTKGNTWLVGITIKAWNYYRRGEAVKQLKFTQGGAHPESVPEPI